jgi:hypothetical protein
LVPPPPSDGRAVPPFLGKYGMPTPSREAVLIAAEVLGLAARRGHDPGGNVADALEMLERQLLAWGEDRIRPRELRRNVGEILAALRDTAPSARPGEFLRRHEATLAGDRSS